MANTIREKVSNGVTTLYDVDFDLGYILEDYVYVYQGEHPNYETQLSYVWRNSTQIELAEPLPSGEVFYIRRVVPRDKIVNMYEDGAILREKNLDDSFLQAVMILQEIEDGFIDPSGTFKVDSDLDMLGHKIVNIGEASEGGDAINLQQATNTFVNLDGDNMRAPLGGVPSVESHQFMPQDQITNTIATMINNAFASIGEGETFHDFGLITREPGNVWDYGGLI